MVVAAAWSTSSARSVAAPSTNEVTDLLAILAAARIRSYRSGSARNSILAMRAIALSVLRRCVRRLSRSSVSVGNRPHTPGHMSLGECPEFAAMYPIPRIPERWSSHLPG